MSDPRPPAEDGPTTAIRPGTPAPQAAFPPPAAHQQPAHQQPQQPQHQAPHPLAAQQAAPQQAQQPLHQQPQQPAWGAPQYQQPVPPRLDPQRKRRGVGILAAALLVGGAAGLGGAALYGEVFQDAATGKIGPEDVDTSGLDPVDLVSVQSVALKALPTVVKIEASTGTSGATGSGVIISKDGEILTNYHVAHAGLNGDIKLFFDDGTTADAEVVGSDPAMDIALLKAEGVEDLPAATFGRSEDIKVGQAVVAVGAPYGLDATVTAGIISTVNRGVEVPSMDNPSSGKMIYPALQTDAAINPGNSGGALVNMKGELVGMNSANELARGRDQYSSSDLGSIGIGYAIPIHVAAPILDQLREGEDPTHAWLGITSARDAKYAGLAKGALVREVDSSVTDGIRTGDVILAIDDRQVPTALSMYTTSLLYRPGDKVTVTLERDGDEVEVEVTLAETDTLFE
jgi:putative serine protease PepD